MAWDFTTEPEFQAEAGLGGQVRPGQRRTAGSALSRSWPSTPLEEPLRSLVNQLKDEVRAQDLWAAHLDPELGGKGYGQLKLALLNEILGRSGWAPIVFGCAAPDTGNAEIIAAYGTPEQKERYLEPLLEGEASPATR